MARISRAAYAQMFGPTTGDRVRLADTELFVEVEKDFTTYGEEILFATGKTARDGMGVCPIADRQTYRAADLISWPGMHRRSDIAREVARR